MDEKELQTLAERCIRLAKAETNQDLARSLMALAEQYQERARALRGLGGAGLHGKTPP